MPFLGSDIIAGFVGETDDDFANTDENLKKSGLTQIHTFPYSIRKGTIAEKLEGHVSDNVKEYRASVIKQVSKLKFNAFLDKNVGTTHQILVEKHLDKHTGFLKGVTENYLKVIVKDNSDENLLNSLQKVKILEVKDNTLLGELVK